MKIAIVAIAAFLVGAGSASAAEPVLGNWTTASGETARISSCGGAYCITLLTGKAKGRQIGRMSGADGSYSGEITDPKAEKTYAGSAKVTGGGSLKLTGCALKIFCKSQTWSRQ